MTAHRGAQKKAQESESHLRSKANEEADRFKAEISSLQEKVG
jgi:hypothetical protein